MKGVPEDEAEGNFMGAMGVTEEEKRQARIGVMTNVATFAAIVFALRVGKGISAGRSVPSLQLN